MVTEILISLIGFIASAFTGWLGFSICTNSPKLGGESFKFWGD